MTKKNGFELHDIDHVSYSAIETYRSDPAKYILTYGCKVRGSTNANMARGNAVEHGIEIALSDEFGDIEDAINAAVKSSIVRLPWLSVKRIETKSVNY